MPSTASTFRADLAANLGLGLRLAVFGRPPAGALRAGWSQFVALAALGIAVPFAGDFVRVGAGGDFNPAALPGAVFHLPLLFLAAWALAQLAGRSERTLEALVALAALTIPIGVADQIVAAGLPQWPRGWLQLLDFLPFLWLPLAAAVAAIRLLGIGPGRRLAGLAIPCLVLGLPLALIERNDVLWLAPYDAAAAAAREQRMALAGEDAFYLQPQLLASALAALQPGRRGVIDLYFVGAAGDSNQDVFMKEMHSVARLFEERFGTAGRSVMLINNPGTVTESPIASATSLELTLRRVGELIDRDEDILFLFLTSHGSEDHHFALDFWPLRFNTLDPRRLRQLLDASGIRRRVVVVSACYAGGFIEALKNDDTLVITAAAPDKTSFGCSNEADFTYFGKAYFDEALRRTDSFVEAFELARPAIAARERDANFEHSDPRIDVGAGIGRALDDYVRQRRRTPATLPVNAAAHSAGDRGIARPQPAS